MYDLKKQLPGLWVKDEDGSIDGLGGQITLVCFVDGDSINVGIVDKPYDLVGE